jgi:hypothetical protein
MPILPRPSTPTDLAWQEVRLAYKALTVAIRSKPQQNTVSPWQLFALKCQILANTMWAEEKALAPVPTPPPEPAPQPKPPFDPRITTWVDSDGNEGFDFPSCPFKVGNP